MRGGSVLPGESPKIFVTEEGKASTAGGKPCPRKQHRLNLNNMEKTIMPRTTKIHVTATDNELYILASTPRGSFEICHIKSGFNDPVEYTVVPQSILPSG